MLIIPAVDILGGQAVRLRRGDLAQQTVYGAPVDFARRWEAAGAQLIHLVDLEGAVGGRPANLSTVRDIAQAVSVPLELGGGLRTLEDVTAAFEAGMQYAIIGTSALRDRAFLQEALAQFGERIIVGLDAREGRVAVEGWVEGSAVEALDFARELEQLGVRRVIFTDIATDGMLQGPNVAATRRLAEAVGMEVVHSGGVTTLDDLREIAALEPLGVVGAIVGRALYEGTIDLAEAIRALS